MRINVAPLAVLTLLFAACTTHDSGTATEPLFELVDPDQRIAPEAVNAHVYGSFIIPGADGPITILSGPANFPGNPPGGPGTCVDGLWYNSKGKPTAGTLTHPHPHCVTPGSATTVVLEPISVQADHDPSVTVAPCKPGTLICRYLKFGDLKGFTLSVVAGEAEKTLIPYTTGSGTVYAYAIDASTLNGTNVRVGTIKFSLTWYTDDKANLFSTCSVGADEFACFPLVIGASYEPLAVGGVGAAQAITGFLWWAGAASPYNY